MPIIKGFTIIITISLAITISLIGAKAYTLNEVAKVSVNGQLFDKQVIVNELKVKLRDKKPLTASFDKSKITDVTKRDAIISDYLKKCGAIKISNYSGTYPIPMDVILDAVNKGC